MSSSRSPSPSQPSLLYTWTIVFQLNQRFKSTHIGYVLVIKNYRKITYLTHIYFQYINICMHHFVQASPKLKKPWKFFSTKQNISIILGVTISQLPEKKIIISRSLCIVRSHPISDPAKIKKIGKTSWTMDRLSSWTGFRIYIVRSVRIFCVFYAGYWFGWSLFRALLFHLYVPSP